MQLTADMEGLDAQSKTLLHSKEVLAVIKLGAREYNGEKGDEGHELLHFLNAIMYPHREDFMETISDYIDFSENKELRKEEPHMFSLSQCIYEEGMEEGRQK